MPTDLPPITDDDRQFLHYNPNTYDIVEFVQTYARAAAFAEREACKRKLLLDLWDALPGHEATGDTAGSLRAMLMLSDVGDEIKTRSNVK